MKKSISTLIVISAFGASCAMATDYTWLGGDSNWSNTANWAGATLPATNTRGVSGNGNKIIITNGVAPSVNVPTFNGGSGGTPQFIVDDGLSLSIDMADGGYDGIVGQGQKVTVGTGSSLIWGNQDVNERMNLARDPGGGSIFTYTMNGGTFTINADIEATTDKWPHGSIEFGKGTDRFANMDLDGGIFDSGNSTTIWGNEGANSSTDFAGSRAVVTLNNGSTFDSSDAVMERMYDSNDAAVLVFELQDTNSTVVVKVGSGGVFGNTAAVAAQAGNVWLSPAGFDLTFTDMGGSNTVVGLEAGTPVVYGPVTTWLGTIDNNWNTASNWLGGVLPQINATHGVYGSDAIPASITIQNGAPNMPALNVPEYAVQSPRTPHFILEAGTSFSINQSTEGWSGWTGDGDKVTVGSGATLTMISPNNEFQLARDPGGIRQVVRINGGTLNLQGNRMDFGFSAGRHTSFLLDAGTVNHIGTMTFGARDNKGDYSTERNIVTLTNGSSFNMNGWFGNVYQTNNIDPAITFDFTTEGDSVTFKLDSNNGSFADQAAVEAAEGSVWLNSTGGTLTYTTNVSSMVTISLVTGLPSGTPVDSTSFAYGDGTNVIGWDSVVGNSYNVLGNDNLTISSRWHVVAGPVAAPLNSADLPATNSAFFYKIEVN